MISEQAGRLPSGSLFPYFFFSFFAFLTNDSLTPSMTGMLMRTTITKSARAAPVKTNAVLLVTPVTIRSVPTVTRTAERIIINRMILQAVCAGILPRFPADFLLCL